MAKPINIFFNECAGGLQFVEIETDEGKSISIGRWHKVGEYKVLRITELPALTITADLDLIEFVANNYRVDPDGGAHCFFCGESEVAGVITHAKDCLHVKTRNALAGRDLNMRYLDVVETSNEAKCPYEPGGPECGCWEAKFEQCGGSLMECLMFGNRERFGGSPKRPLSETIAKPEVSPEDAIEIKRAVAEVSKRLERIKEITKFILDDTPQPCGRVRCEQCGSIYLKGAMCPKCFGR